MVGQFITLYIFRKDTAAFKVFVIIKVFVEAERYFQ